MSVLAPLLIGAAFGWLLHKARLGRYETIVNVFRFTDLTVVKFLVSALMVSMLGLQALVALGLARAVPVPPSYLLGNLAGGLLFGAGMALAGFCPGTVAAGAGEGRLDYLVPGTLGLLAGALLFGWLYPALFPALGQVGRLGEITLLQALHVDAWLVVALFWEVALLLFYALAHPQRQRGGAARRPL